MNPCRRLRFWQQNCNTSHTSLSHILSVADPSEWDVVFLQEPPFTRAGTITVNSHWFVILPSAHGKDDARARSAILVNKRLATNAWEELPSSSRDLSGLRLRTELGTVDIYNLYSDQATAEGLDDLERIMDSGGSRGESDYVIWLGDFNAHNSLWEPQRNAHLWRARKDRERGDRIIALLAEYGMLMALPGDKPTLETHGRTKNRTRPDNVFCSADLLDYIVTCDTREPDRGPRTDHFPVVTELDVSVDASDGLPRRNWRAVDWDKFRRTLVEELAKYPDPSEPLTEDEFRLLCERLTASFQKAADRHAPEVRPSPYLKRWWTAELTKEREHCRSLGRVSEKWETVPDHPVHAEYRSCLDEYGRMLDSAKSSHWEEWLETLDAHSVWNAHKYVNDLPMDCRSARVPTLEKREADGSTRKLRDNKSKGEEFFCSFFPQHPGDVVLPEIDIALRDLADAHFVTREQIRRAVANLSPYKALGHDGIPNVAIKKCIAVVEECVTRMVRARSGQTTKPAQICRLRGMIS
ncbi:DNase I-like protein [Exidia glandulosa HHB12029]|uniref:DNase I-like protein n=1 Tax=Exidia glandulosa HHB12029 TaxID=1314781 RepID=A0A165JMU0_EXIGL|nr:DNase I-like protein [Exidia glandulosa HHB12029]